MRSALPFRWDVLISSDFLQRHAGAPLFAVESLQGLDIRLFLFVVPPPPADVNVSRHIAKKGPETQVGKKTNEINPSGTGRLGKTTIEP